MRSVQTKNMIGFKKNKRHIGCGIAVRLSSGFRGPEQRFGVGMVTRAGSDGLRYRIEGELSYAGGEVLFEAPLSPDETAAVDDILRRVMDRVDSLLKDDWKRRINVRQS